MPATGYPVAIRSLCIRPSFSRASLEKPSSEPNRIAARRMLRIQARTDLYVHLDTDPQHRLAHCSTVYELEDRTRPSVSSF